MSDENEEIWIVEVPRPPGSDFYGPFDDIKKARVWARRHVPDADWSVACLLTPNAPPSGIDKAACQ